MKADFVNSLVAKVAAFGESVDLIDARAAFVAGFQYINPIMKMLSNLLSKVTSNALGFLMS